MVKWMGRYRSLVEQLVLFSHIGARARYTKLEMREGLWLSPVDWQVLEYVYEHAEDRRMIHICEKIGLAQSTFSRSAKVLSGYGLIARYHTTDNKKNIIIRITDSGRELYEEYSVFLRNGPWGRFFKLLEDVPDEYLDRFTSALKEITSTLPVEKEQPQLIEIEQ